MKKLNIRFDRDKEKSDIDIVITASEKDVQVRAIIDKIRDPLAGTLTVYDSYHSVTTIPDSDIVSISTEDKHLKVVAETGTYELRTSLRELIEHLDPQQFIQISRFEIINLSQVRRFDFSVSGALMIEMKNGITTWASRRHISEIKRKFMGEEK